MIRYRFGEETWTTLDLKGREVEQLEKQLDMPWVRINPLASMRDRLAVLAVFLGRTRTEEQVVAIIDELDLRTLETMVVLEEDDIPEAWSDGFPLPAAQAPGTGTPG